MSADVHVYAMGRLYDLGRELGDEALIAAVNAVGSALVAGTTIAKADRWVVADALMALVCGPMATRWPVIDASGGEWTEADVSAALVLLEEVSR